MKSDLAFGAVPMVSNVSVSMSGGCKLESGGGKLC